MRSRHVFLLTALCLGLAPAIAAAQSDSTRRPITQRVAVSSTSGTTPNRDVILEIPELSVDSIGLTV